MQAFDIRKWFFQAVEKTCTATNMWENQWLTRFIGSKDVKSGKIGGSSHFAPPNLGCRAPFNFLIGPGCVTHAGLEFDQKMGRIGSELAEIGLLHWDTRYRLIPPTMYTHIYITSRGMPKQGYMNNFCKIWTVLGALTQKMGLRNEENRPAKSKPVWESWFRR